MYTYLSHFATPISKQPLPHVKPFTIRIQMQTSHKFWQKRDLAQLRNKGRHGTIT